MQSLLYGLFGESPWNSESVQIPYKIINDSLWAKLTCFPYNYIYYMLSLHQCLVVFMWHGLAMLPQRLTCLPTSSVYLPPMSSPSCVLPLHSNVCFLYRFQISFSYTHQWGLCASSVRSMSSCKVETLSFLLSSIHRTAYLNLILVCFSYPLTLLFQ